MIDRKQMYSKEIDSPAIVVCPRNQISKNGWKGEDISQNDPSLVMIGRCTDEMTGDDLMNCIDDHTFSLIEAIVSARASNMINILNDSAWDASIGYIMFGKCYTLQLTAGSIGFSVESSLELEFNSSLDYFVFIGDPNFFVITSNPRTIPRILFSLNKDYGKKLVYIDVIQHIKLNRKDNPCQESLEYSFTKCMKTNTATKIGCRQKWDKSFESDLPFCTTKEQLWKHGEEYWKFLLLEQRELLEYTGCPLPCSYTEYKLVDTPVDGFASEPSLHIMFGSGNIRVEKEEETFSFGSFVAECGGCLGLFLGFSFLMVWDMFLNMVWKVKEIFR